MPAPYRLRLFENYRFVLYAPFYAAHATGAYEAEGVEVELLASPGPGRAEAALLAGEVDVMWMGPIRIMNTMRSAPARRSPPLPRWCAATRSRWSAPAPIPISASPTSPRFALPASARCRPRGCA